MRNNATAAALCAAFVLLSASACRRSEFVILHVNDTHSHLEPLRSDGRGGVIERAAIVDSVRAARGEDNVLLLHAGDFNQGTSYYTEFGGEAELEAFNAMRYDCLTLGNHEFDAGLENLASRLRRLCCPVVCANIDFTGSPLEGLVLPYVTIERAGRRIGIIGLTSDLLKNVSAKSRAGITQTDNAEAVNRCSEALAGENCDLVILLSHIGYGEDISLVPQIRGVDLVIGGHSHTFVDGFKEVPDLDGRPVRIVTDGMWGVQIGEITLR